MFVTWKIGSQLLGCIGTIKPVLIRDYLREYAIKSATEDPRFSAIDSLSDDLSVTVSRLSNFKELNTITDWSIGINGIILKIFDDGTGVERQYSATYLPEVALEQGWTKAQTLLSLAEKARAPPKLIDLFRTGEYSLINMKLVSFETHARSMVYRDYAEHG